MGSHPAKALVLLLLMPTGHVGAVEPGWHYSPLPGEGDRASLGCSKDATEDDFACLAVRCEDDYSVGLHVYSSRVGGDVGIWKMTLDREDRTVEAVPDDAPYGARLLDPEGWLFDRLQQGTFAYLRHEDDGEDGFAFISLAGSYHAIREALYWCAPRQSTEQKADPDVGSETSIGVDDEPPPPRTQ
ncbi:MAG: hypothetical protein GX970_00850 [Phyllobacteriaceae bacterium]|nr:hypothetical protein [Phyllobacteriaceae bacterium]